MVQLQEALQQVLLAMIDHRNTTSIDRQAQLQEVQEPTLLVNPATTDRRNMILTDRQAQLREVEQRDQQLVSTNTKRDGIRLQSMVALLSLIMQAKTEPPLVVKTVEFLFLKQAQSAFSLEVLLDGEIDP